MTCMYFNRFPLYVDLTCPYTLGKIWFLIECLGLAIFAKLPIKVRSICRWRSPGWRPFYSLSCNHLSSASNPFYAVPVHALHQCSETSSVGAGGRGNSTPTDFLLGATFRFPLNPTVCTCLCWKTKVVPIQITLHTQARRGEGSAKPKVLSDLMISPFL